MLPAAARMRRSGEFRTAVRSGRRAAGGALVVHLAGPTAPAPATGARVGFVVGRQVGAAVVRNRVRRRLRHLMRARLDRLPGGSLTVVRATPAAAQLSAAELSAALDRALDRALRTRVSGGGVT